MRILLIEDEMKLSSFVKRGLVAERYAVDVATDGRSGLDLAETYQYDLIVLDRCFPEWMARKCCAESANKTRPCRF